MNYLGLWKHWEVLLFPSIFLTGALGCATRKYMCTFCDKQDAVGAFTWASLY